jgi:hypothetical protein
MKLSSNEFQLIIVIGLVIIFIAPSFGESTLDKITYGLLTIPVCFASYMILKTKLVIKILKENNLFFDLEDFFAFENVPLKEKIKIEQKLKDEIYDYLAIIKTNLYYNGYLKTEHLILGKYIIVFGQKPKGPENTIITKALLTDQVLTRVNKSNELQETFTYEYFHSEPNRLRELVDEHLKQLEIEKYKLAEIRENELSNKASQFISDYKGGNKLIDEVILLGLKNKCLKNANKIRDGVFLLNIPIAYKLDNRGVYKFKLPDTILEPYDLLYDQSEIRQILGERFLERILEDYDEAPDFEDVFEMNEKKYSELTMIFDNYDEWNIVFDILKNNKILNTGFYYYFKDKHSYYYYSQCQMKVIYNFLDNVNKEDAIEKFEFNS